jgi:VanZ family protein
MWIETLQTPTLRRLYAVVWVALVTVTLLQSSSSPVVGPPAPPGPPDYEREIFLTTGHIVAFSIMLVLVWWALRPAPHALPVAFVTCCALGILTEFLQALVPDRSVSFGDLAVNCLVSAAAALLIYWKESRPTHS